MNIYTRSNDVQKLRELTRAKLYYFEDAWCYVADTFDAVDDRIHPGTWRGFTPLTQQSLTPHRAALALSLQRRPWSGDSTINQNSNIIRRLPARF